MQISQYNADYSNLAKHIEESANKVGSLTSTDLGKLENEVETLKEAVLSKGVFEQEKDVSKDLDVSAKVNELDNRVKDIRERNLSIQMQKFDEFVTNGKIPFDFFEKNTIPYGDKLKILLTKAPKNAEQNPEMMITGIPDKKVQKTGEMRLVIKEDAIVGGNKDKEEIYSQLSDPVYRGELLNHRNEKHYNFEFFDIERNKEIEATKADLKREKGIIDDVGVILGDFLREYDEEAFNKAFTEEQRAQFNIPKDKKMTDEEIFKLQEEWQNESEFFPYKEESKLSEFDKPTLRCRIAQSGAIGELKSVNIHSEKLGGKQLMDAYEKLCVFMAPAEMYLEDDAKIEGNSGSYNLKLFRLVGLDDKSSWYHDVYGYQQYQKDSSQGILNVTNPAQVARDRVKDIKSLTLENLSKLLNKSGSKLSKDLTQVIEKYRVESPNKTLSEVVKGLGDRVQKNTNEPLHKDLHLLLTGVFEAFSKYEGEDQELLKLKNNAKLTLDDHFLRKSYVTT